MLLKIDLEHYIHIFETKMLTTCFLSDYHIENKSIHTSIVFCVRTKDEQYRSISLQSEDRPGQSIPRHTPLHIIRHRSQLNFELQNHSIMKYVFNQIPLLYLLHTWEKRVQIYWSTTPILVYNNSIYLFVYQSNYLHTNKHKICSPYRINEFIRFIA